MSTITTYERPSSGDLIIEITLRQKDVFGLVYNEEELEILRKVSNGELTEIEMLKALVMLLEKIEERNKNG